MMWELVRANKRRSTVLVLLMLALLLSIGWIIGAVALPLLDGQTHANARHTRNYADGNGTDFIPADTDRVRRDIPLGGFAGMGIAFVLWTGQAIISYYFGGKILLAVSGARRIEKDDAPQLYNVVEEMVIAAQLPKVPDLYIMDDPGMNAFATGRDPQHSAIAVTSGLLANLNRDQLQGVIAHEVSHVVHRDVLYMTMVSIMLGTIVLICEGFFQTMRVIGNGSRYSSRSNREGGGAALLVLYLLALVLYLIAPLLAQLIYFAISRRREYLADAGAAIFTRYPEGLASALEQLEHQTEPLARASKATAPMYITNPFAGKASLLMSTHPPTAERIKILRSLGGQGRESGQVSYAGYEKAYEQARGGRLVPQGAMGLAAAPLRAASAVEDAPEDVLARRREAGDLVRKVNDFTFLACTCGARVKVPAGFPKPAIACPRCGSQLQVIPAEDASPSVGSAPPDGIPYATPKRRDTVAPAATATEATPLVYTRKGGGWESVKCSCGAIKNIAPSFTAPQTNCTRCGRTILLR